MYSGGAVLMAALHYGAGYYVDALAMAAPNYRAAALRRLHLLAAVVL